MYRSKVCNTCSGHKTITILWFTFWEKGRKDADKLIAKRHLSVNVAFNMSRGLNKANKQTYRMAFTSGELLEMPTGFIELMRKRSLLLL